MHYRSRRALSLALLLLVFSARPVNAAVPAILVWLGGFVADYGLGKLIDCAFFDDCPFGQKATARDWTGDIEQIRSEQQRVGAQLQALDAGVAQLRTATQQHDRLIDDLERRVRAGEIREVARRGMYADAVNGSALFASKLKLRRYYELLGAIERLPNIVQRRDRDGLEHIYFAVRDYQTYKADLDSEQRFVDGVIQNLEEMKRRLSGHDRLLAEYGSALERHGAAIANLRTRVNQHDVTLQDYEKRLVEQHDTLQEQAVELERVNDVVKRHDTMLENLRSIVLTDVIAGGVEGGTGATLVINATKLDVESDRVSEQLKLSLAKFADDESLTIRIFADEPGVTRSGTKYLIRHTVHCYPLHIGRACSATLEARSSSRRLGTCVIEGVGRTDDVAFDDLISQIRVLDVAMLLRGRSCRGE